MRANGACLTALLAVLAACGRGSSGAGSFVPPATNLSLAAVDLWGAGELRIARVAESDDGRDGNGDGDALDVLAVVLDLTDGSRHDLGIALDSLRMPVAGDVLAALLVSRTASTASPRRNS